MTRIAVACLLMATAAGACQDSEQAPVLQSPLADSVGEALEAPDSTLRREPLDSIRSFRLWLVNTAAVPVIVDANAGAEDVFVDSLLALDSARVDLKVRADSVRLNAKSLSDSALGAIWLYEGPDSVARVELP